MVFGHLFTVLTERRAQSDASSMISDNVVSESRENIYSPSSIWVMVRLNRSSLVDMLDFSDAPNPSEAKNKPTSPNILELLSNYLSNILNDENLDKKVTSLQTMQESFNSKLNETLRETVKDMIFDPIEDLALGKNYETGFTDHVSLLTSNISILHSMLESDKQFIFSEYLNACKINNGLKIQLISIYDMVHEMRNKSLQFKPLKLQSLDFKEHLMILKDYNKALIEEKIYDFEKELKEYGIKMIEQFALEHEINISENQISHHEVWKNLDTHTKEPLIQNYLNTLTLPKEPITSQSTISSVYEINLESQTNENNVEILGTLTS
ncbi:MAG: hypothetical protein K0R02_1143 [Rickettsiaceae bacterium]|jgi:hypothetical protein|nr:hypothetical protein [Rickettsiaceae bacterium]